jgi:DNA-binding transcriptional ArsR family regulator
MEILDILKILADETRFKIVELLLTHDFCVGALAGALGISEPAVSQHIQILRKGGLLKGEKRGYWTHYSVERSVLNQVAEGLKDLAARPAARQFVCLRESLKRTDIARGQSKMCKCKCEHPEKLKGKPGQCSKEQIKECHGEQESHSCEEKEQ